MLTYVRTININATTNIVIDNIIIKENVDFWIWAEDCKLSVL